MSQISLKEQAKAYHENLKKGLAFQIGNKKVPKAKYFSYKPSLRVEAQLVKAAANEELMFTTFEGTNKTLQTFGKLKFDLQGKRQNLLLFREGVAAGNPLANKYLLLPFTDDTNGITTYGGGRYIQLDQTEISDNKVWIDFNYAYTPWCAFASDYSCPIPPKENRLNLKIEGGEKFKDK